MKNQKDTLATLTPQQSNPYTAQPTDFEILKDTEPVFHGQCDATKQAGKASRRQDRPTEASDAKNPHQK